MMVITSKLYLTVIHEATKNIEQSKLSDMDKIHLNMQERVLKDLEDWEPDDCMIDGYDHSAFSPYKDLVPSVAEVTKDKFIQCTDCTHVYPKESVVFEGEYLCGDCLTRKKESSKQTDKEGVSL